MNRDDYLDYLKFMKKNRGKGLQYDVRAKVVLYHIPDEGISRVNLIREMARARRLPRLLVEYGVDSALRKRYIIRGQGLLKRSPDLVSIFSS